MDPETVSQRNSEQIYCNSPPTAEQTAPTQNRTTQQTKRGVKQQPEFNTLQANNPPGQSDDSKGNSEDFYSGLDPMQADPTDVYEAPIETEQKAKPRPVVSPPKSHEIFHEEVKGDAKLRSGEAPFQCEVKLKSPKIPMKGSAVTGNRLTRILQKKKYRLICAITLIMLGAMLAAVVGGLITGAAIKNQIKELISNELFMTTTTPSQQNFTETTNLTAEQ